MLTLARGRLIERQRVTGQIIDGLERGSVLLTAGAGFGKTTALRQALDVRQQNVAWVRCGDACADAGRLLGLILDAVCRVCPGAADVLSEQLVGARAPIDPSLATAALQRELDSVLVEPLVVVLDDGETVNDTPGAVDVIGRLLVAESDVLHIALAARRRLDVHLARALAGGRIVELGPPELAFSAPECAAYLRQLRGGDPPVAKVEELLAATGGWPLGIALVVSQGEIPTLGLSPQLADDYFAEEVYAPLAADLQRALLGASTAPDLDIAEQAGLGPEEGFAGAIDRGELFVRTDADPGRRELHPLFREFLRSRFEAEVPIDERQQIADKIAGTLDAMGRGVEAVGYYLAAHDWQAATQGIAREGPALVRRAADTVDGWIRALPAEHARRPELQLLSGELAHGQGRFAEAVALCRSAVEGFDAEAPADRRFAARFALADVLMAVGDLDGVGALANVLEEPDAGANLAARAVGVVAAAGLARQGRFEEGRSLFERALDDPSATGLMGLRSAFAAYYLELPAGRLDDALAHAREAVAQLEITDPTGRLPYALTYLMAILDERGEDEEALEIAERTRAWARRVGLSGWVGVALAIRAASLRGRAGDLTGAEAALAEVPAAGWEAWGAWELDATRAMIAVLRRDGAEALATAERAAREANLRWPYLDRARCAALLAPVFSSAGDPQQALQLVEQTIASRASGFSTARLHAVLAWLLHDEGDEQGSIAALGTACFEAGDQLKHVIRREWPRIERVVWAALEAGALEVTSTTEAMAAARPGGAALAAFTRHPVGAVRGEALLRAVAAGHPDAIERVPELLHDRDHAVVSAARAAHQLLVRSPPRIEFRVLGRFEVRRGTWLVDDSAWGRRVAQRVIRLLVCRGGGPVPEDELIEAFWPDKVPGAARRGIQVAVSAARSVLDPPGVQRSRLLCSERTYRLQLYEGDTIDAEGFDRAARLALAAGPDSRLDALSDAAALWTGEPLPEERYSAWASVWRERLLDRYGEVLAALSEAYEQSGEMAQATEMARRLVELDPLNEAAHCRLMVAFARTGRRGHALRQFLACRRALVTELGIEPGEATTALQRRVLAGEPV